ncbi:MAG: protein translocase subunit SecD [Bdellovibrionales bacterium]|nr:protein translocase subunit SecD [Bdellovibrionales bacterium]
MIENPKARWAIIAAALVLAVVYLVPNFADFGEDDWWFTKEKIVYGLDIQGGLHLVMGVDVEGVIREKTKRMAGSFEQDLKEAGASFQKVEIPENQRDRVVVSVNSSAEVEGVKKLVNDRYPATLQILTETQNEVVLRYFDDVMLRYKNQVVEQAIEVIRNRIDEFGVSEPSIAAQGTDRILIQLPGIKESARAKELINKTAKLNFRIVSYEKSPAELQGMIVEAEKAGNFTLGNPEENEEPVKAEDGSKEDMADGSADKPMATGAVTKLRYSEYVDKINDALKSQLPEGSMIAFEKVDGAESLEVAKTPYLLSTKDGEVISGELLEDAFMGFDRYNKPAVNFRMNVEGARAMSTLTGQNIEKQMAIVLDKVIQSAPTIQSEIAGEGQITLGGRDYEKTMSEGKLVATALRAGALPAALTQLEERTVGPTLGIDAINRGKQAGLVGLVLIILFMFGYYRQLGIVANIALALNVAMLLAILSSLQATLTLPGVAGIVLTLGMAVDANVIIFERVKEELRKGAGTMAAIKDGFGHAFSAIFDANITTAIVCVVLMYYGTGPVRGFAVTLICGIITSMFTAIFVSRTILEYMVLRMGMKQIAKV